MNEVAALSLQDVLAEIARSSEADFDLIATLRGLAKTALSYTGASAVQITRESPGNGVELLVAIGEARGGNPKRVPIVADGQEAGALVLFGANMFGPATAERTQVLADLAAVAMQRAARSHDVSIDPTRYRLITGVGHNLRNTLGAASGYMQLVDMQGSLSQQQQEFIGRGRRAINAAVTLISDLLELTRADAGKLTFDREPVHVPAVARSKVRKHQDTAVSKNVNIARSEEHTSELQSQSNLVCRLLLEKKKKKKIKNEKKK